MYGNQIGLTTSLWMRCITKDTCKVNEVGAIAAAPADKYQRETRSRRRYHPAGRQNWQRRNRWSYRLPSKSHSMESLESCAEVQGRNALREKAFRDCSGNPEATTLIAAATTSAGGVSVAIGELVQMV